MILMLKKLVRVMSLRGLMINDYVGDVQIMVIMLNDEEMMM